MSQTESNGGGVPQFAPNFLFGAQHASKRRNLAFPVSRTAVGSPGILKAKEANLSPGAKNVHWSPLLVRERSVSPGSRKDEQCSKDREKSENAKALWNGPPLRSIRDDLGPPEKQVRLEQTPNCSASFNNVSSVHDFEGAETSFSAQSDRNFWVTVFGFSLDHASAILELFSKHGNIVSQKAPKVGNYIHIRYSSMVHAKQALARNAKIFDGMMIGVVPCSDRDIVGEEGVAIPASSSVYVFNASSNDANKDGVPDGSRMVPSVSGTQNMSLPKVFSYRVLTSGFAQNNQIKFEEFKMVLVGGVGALIAVVSTFNNLVLLHTFLFSKKLLPRRNLTYLTCLSFCDFLVSVFYISIMSTQVYAEYFDSEWLFVVWHECLPLAFTISNVTFAVGSFLLVAATIERYLQTINNPRSTALWQMMGKHRQFGVLLAVSCGLLLRGSIFFEIETYHLQHCTGLASMGVLLSSLAKDPYYDSIWRFWIRRITTIFVPFFVLAYCNSTIVYSVQMEEEKDQRIKTLILFLAKGSPRQFVGRGFQNQVQKSSARLRSATRMLIAVVTCYLLANMLDVFLASWEYLDGQSLAEMSGFYTVATDVSSLLSVLSSSLRLPIYLLVGDKLLQTEIKRTLRSICLLFTPIGYKGLAKKSIFNAKFKGSHHPNSPTNFGLQNSKQAKLSQQNHHLLESPLPLSSSCENSGFLNNSGIGVLIQARGVIFTSSKKATEMYVERKISSVEHIRLLDECGAVNETQVMQWTKEI